MRVTSPDRVVFPARGLTKLDVVQYFLDVGDGILGALVDRPTTLERWPKGVFEGARMSTRTDSTGDAFYQKRIPKGAPDWVQTARIAFPSGRTADEVCPTELAVVAWAANLGTLTFHPWPVRGGDVEAVDQLRIDLDPSRARTSTTPCASRRTCARSSTSSASRLPQDVGRPRDPRVRPGRARVGLRGRAPRDDRDRS